MAANAPLDAQLTEWAYQSIEVQDIPEKLRCANCDKLAVNTVKLPCCDNTICNHCAGRLPDTECPICMHSPFSASLCVPAKSLQNTIKAWIRTQAKKQGYTPAGSAQTLAPGMPTPDSTDIIADPAQVVETATAESAVQDSAATVVYNSEEHPVQTFEDSLDTHGEMLEHQAPSNGAIPTEQDENDEEDDDDDDVVITLDRPEHEDNNEESALDPSNTDDNMKEEVDRQQEMQMTSQQGFGFDQNMGNFNNGNFGDMMAGGFNPMMGMQGFGMGMPNMMSMPNMSMDQSMMFNGNFGNMGDMSMMGMGSMVGMNGIGGMGNFAGMGAPGFFPSQGNYMQSNFGNHQRQNFFHDRGHGRPYGRGYGRGRGNFGRGRGGWGYQQPHQYAQNQQNNSFGPQQSRANTEEVAQARRASLADGAQGTPTDAREQPDPNNQDRPTQDTDQAVAETDKEGERMTESEPSKSDATVLSHDSLRVQDSIDQFTAQQAGTTASNGNQIPNVQSSENGTPQGPYDNGAQHRSQFNNFRGRGGFQGRGGFNARGHDITELTASSAPPINAPTGPKAMRQGLPNTGWSSRIGMNTQQKPVMIPQPQPRVEPTKDQNSRPQTRDRNDREKQSSRSRSPPRYHGGSKHRDAEPDDEYESDETYARRKERERRKRKDRERRDSEDDRAGSKDREDSSHKYRSRSHSRTDDSSRRRHRDRHEEYRSSRSRRDRSSDKHRRRHSSRSAERDTEDERSRRKSKSHRGRADDDDDHSDRYRDGHKSRRSSHRDDDYDDDKKKDRSHRSSRHGRSSRDDGRDRESDRERTRDRGRDQDKPRAVLEPPSDELGFKIKGSKSAKDQHPMAPPVSRDRSDRRSGATESPSDPYAEERARAQQDREAREAQRRQSTQSSSLGKRSRDEEEVEVPRGPKSDRDRERDRVKRGRKDRKLSYRYEDEIEMR